MSVLELLAVFNKRSVYSDGFVTRRSIVAGGSQGSGCVKVVVVQVKSVCEVLWFPVFWA